MPRKSFAAMIDPAVIELTTFEITGHYLTYVDGRPVEGEPYTAGPFRCLPEIPAVALDRLAKSIGTNNRGETTYNAPSVVDFLRSVLIPEDRDAFDALIEDSTRLIRLELLAEIMGWVTEELTARPTGR